jgi:ribosomal protein S18 acetylase RimI-like enzyme
VVDKGIFVRPYQDSDQAGVEWLYARTPPWGRTYPRPQPVPEEIRQLGDSYEHVLVAVENDRDGEAVVGMVAIEGSRSKAGSHVPPPDFLDVQKPTCRLHWVLVAPERWRQGIGRRMTQTAIAWACDQGYESMILDTTPQQQAAVALYESMGFKEIGRSRFREYDLVWFRLVL